MRSPATHGKNGGRDAPGLAFGFNLIALDSHAGETANCWMGIAEGMADGKDPSLFRTFILAE